MDDEELVAMIMQWLEDEEAAAKIRADNLGVILRIVREVQDEQSDL